MRRYLLTLFLVAFLQPLQAPAADVQVVVSGKYFGSVDAYKIGNQYYLRAKDAGDVFGGRVYWYPVTGRVQLSVHGKQIQFVVNSDKARIDQKTVLLPARVLARTANAYIPMDFFLSKDFSDAVGMDSQFTPETGMLSVDLRTNVGPLRWISYKNYTRITLELNGGVTWVMERQGRSFSISMPSGKIDWPEDVSIGDGMVSFLRLTQDARVAKLSIRLQGNETKWNVHEGQSPRRLVIDVYTDAAAMAAAKAQSPLPAAPQSQEPAASQVPASAPVASKKAAASVSSAKAPEAGSSAAKQAPSSETSSAPPNTVVAAPRKWKIVVDAGHGGKDSGALGRHNTREKDINLEAAKELAALLKQQGMFDVMLIRDDDTFVPLDERSKRADDFNADLFVSLHCNAALNKAENGFEVYFVSEKASDPESQRVADAENSVLSLEGKSQDDEAAAGLLHAMARTEFINDAGELAGLVGKDLSQRVDLQNRGVKQAAFYVLRGTDAPAILVEMAFVTNTKDEAKLESRRFRQRLIEGIYAGILDYAQRHGWKTDQGI